MSRGGGDRGNRICECSHRYPPVHVHRSHGFQRCDSALLHFCSDIGNLDHSATDKDIEDAFKKFGSITDVWVARKPPGE